jgi:hypothetical protein
MNKKQFLNAVGEFTWYFSAVWTIQIGNDIYIWSDWIYHGSNKVEKYKGKTPTTSAEWEEFSIMMGVPYGRDKGVKQIGTMVPDTCVFVS